MFLKGTHDAGEISSERQRFKKILLTEYLGIPYTCGIQALRLFLHIYMILLLSTAEFSVNYRLIGCVLMLELIITFHIALISDNGIGINTGR